MLANAAVNAGRMQYRYFSVSLFDFRSSEHTKHQAPRATTNPSTMLTTDQYEVIYTLRAELAKKGVNRFGGRRSWMKDVTPAEWKLLMKYRKKGARRAATGGLFGALAMAGVWKIAALGTAFGVTGVIVGGLVGAWMAMRASRIRLKMVKEMIKLPTDESPHAAEAREILRADLRENPYAQKLLKKAESTRRNQRRKAPKTSNAGSGGRTKATR